VRRTAAKLGLLGVLYVAFGALLVGALYLACLQFSRILDGHAVFRGIAGAYCVAVAIVAWFALRGVERFRRRWGLVRDRTSASIDALVESSGRAPATPCIERSRCGFVVSIYAAAALLLFVGAILLFVSFGWPCGHLVSPASLATGLLGVVLLTAPWFAFDALDPLRRRWGIGSWSAPLPRRNTTTDIFG
jgi:hypothetical protein